MLVVKISLEQHLTTFPCFPDLPNRNTFVTFVKMQSFQCSPRDFNSVVLGWRMESYA